AESAMTSAEEGEPWFPPTDPVIDPEGNDLGGASMAGSVLVTDDDFDAAEDQPAVPVGDDELAGAVELALNADAQTNGLDIQVLVANGVVTLRGTVRSLDDVEAAEEVAARVEGVVDVTEELAVEHV
ncbi:MAG: BON domain-containing protein, partial [Chloroflexota bacterium]|nr:BON domain-containing protein [Chloroflexota bacterium]